MSRVNSQIQKTARILVKNSIELRNFPILVLPSTPAAFSLVAQCAEGGLPMKVVGHPLWMKEWSPGLVEYVHSPLALWRIIKDLSTLPFAVAIFQDQLASVDESFHTVTIEEQKIRVSPIEAMIMMRFGPPTLIGTATEGRAGKPSSLTLTTHVAEISGRMSVSTFNNELASLLGSILKCHRKPVSDWYAREIFAVKIGRNFEDMMSLRIREIESLIRIYQDRNGAPMSRGPSLEQLEKSRQQLVN